MLLTSPKETQARYNGTWYDGWIVGSTCFGWIVRIHNPSKESKWLEFIAEQEDVRDASD